MGNDAIYQTSETLAGKHNPNISNDTELRELGAGAVSDLPVPPKIRSKIRLCAVMAGLNVSS